MKITMDRIMNLRVQRKYDEANDLLQQYYAEKKQAKQLLIKELKRDEQRCRRLRFTS